MIKKYLFSIIHYLLSKQYTKEIVYKLMTKFPSVTSRVRRCLLNSKEEQKNESVFDPEAYEIYKKIKELSGK